MLSIINLQNYKLLFLPSLHDTSFNSLVSLVAYMCDMKEEGSL